MNINKTDNGSKYVMSDCSISKVKKCLHSSWTRPSKKRNAPQRPLLIKALVVPAAIGKNNESCTMLVDVDGLTNLRIPLRMPVSDFDWMVEVTEEGVKEESRARR